MYMFDYRQLDQFKYSTLPCLMAQELKYNVYNSIEENANYAEKLDEANVHPGRTDVTTGRSRRWKRLHLYGWCFEMANISFRLSRFRGQRRRRSRRGYQGIVQV